MSEPAQKCQSNANFKQNCLLLLQWPILAVSIYISFKKRFTTWCLVFFKCPK